MTPWGGELRSQSPSYNLPQLSLSLDMLCYRRSRCYHSSAKPAIERPHVPQLDSSSSNNVRTKCLPILLCGLEVRSINASDISSLDFVISLPRDAIHSPENRKNTLVFHSDREPPNRGVECKGVSKNRDFRPTFRCISEMVDLQDRATVTIECPQKPVPSFRMVSFSMTLNDP